VFRFARPALPLPSDALLIVPVRNAVLFPGTVLPLTVGSERARAAVEEAVRLEQSIGVLLQKSADVDDPGPDDLHWVGTSAGVLRYVTTPEGVQHIICKGLRRFRVLQFLDDLPFAVARVDHIEDPESFDAEIEGRGRALKRRAIEVLQLLPQVPAELAVALQGVDSPSQLADFIAGMIDIPLEERQALLETFDLRARLDKLLLLMARRMEVLKVSRDVDLRTRESIGDLNRKHLLREQMRTIQKELGEGDEGGAEIADLDKAITEAQMPEEVDKVARKELKRLERMPEAAGEYSMLRTYLDWLIELPARRSTLPRPGAFSMRTTSGWERSRSASSSTWRCASSIRRAAVRSCASWGRPGLARPRWGRASRAPPDASSRASAWAACMTSRRSAGIGAPTSAPCPAT
jgi:ATP-dependent Lon protease